MTNRERKYMQRKEWLHKLKRVHTQLKDDLAWLDQRYKLNILPPVMDGDPDIVPFDPGKWEDKLWRPVAAFPSGMPIIAMSSIAKGPFTNFKDGAGLTFDVATQIREKWVIDVEKGLKL